MIGQAEFCPAQIAASLFIVRWTIEELGVENFEPGDVVLHNDPYRGGAHMPEHMRDHARSSTRASCSGSPANVGHVAEIGGKARRVASPPTPPRSSRRACASRR